MKDGLPAMTNNYPAVTTDVKNILLVSIGAVCYSTLIIFTRNVEGLDAMSIAFFRTFFGFLFFSLLMLRFREPLKIRNYQQYIWILVILGVVVGMTAALYIYAIQHTTAANASLLVNSAPIYIAFLAPWVLKESRPRYTLASLLLLVIGVVLITNIAEIRFDLDSLDGILAGILSGFTYSTTFIISRYLKGKVTGFTQTVWGTGIAAVILLPWALQSDGAVVLSNIGVLIPLGIITLGISSFLYYIALQKIKAQIVSVIAILEPVSGALIGLLFFQEIPTFFGLVGILMILASIYLISR
jgi:drug/metabolite transporter (DMT)-like permease